MNAAEKKFLESGLLEQYLLGETNPAESREVEHYLATSKEIKKEYLALQGTIEKAANEMAGLPPTGLRSEILESIDKTEKTTAKNTLHPEKNYWAATASVAALIFGLLAFYFFGKMSDSKAETEVAHQTIERLQNEMETQQAACQTLEEKLLLLSHPDTRTYRLNGNEKAPQLELIAFWNETQNQSLINLAAVPELPGNKCFQVWADVDGEMLNVGILGQEGGSLQAMTFLARATSLNVTIEPEGGSEHPTVTDLVANVAI